MRAVKKRSYDGVAIWASRSETAAGRRRSRLGSMRTHVMPGTKTGRAADWIIRGRQCQGHDRQGKGEFRNEKVGLRRGGGRSRRFIEGGRSRGWRQRQRRSSRREGTKYESVSQEETSGTLEQEQGGQEQRGGDSRRTE